jgi:hypothetical protein
MRASLSQAPVTGQEPLITAPGAYSDIDAADYHRNPNLLPAPSVSSSGLKTLLAKSPAHYWYDSVLNPDRPPEPDKTHFNVGKAAHDMLLLSDRWPECYHILPEGYTAPSIRTKNFSEDQLTALAAKDAGKVLIRWDDAGLIRGMASSLRANPLASAALSNGESEVTICWQDKETGIWLRARPDFLPHKRRIIPDLKTAADASPKGFQRTIANFGYAQAAALYLDGIEAVFGDKPTNWIHVVMEKEPPHVVALYELPQEDIGRGRWLNRRAIRIFADCLSSGKWCGYADEPVMLGLPGWERRVIDEAITPEGVAWGDMPAAA